MLSDTLLSKLRAKRNLPPPDLLRTIRVAAGASQADVAELLGVHRETVSRWERGNRTPSPRNLARYLEVIEELRQVSAA